MRNIKFIKAMRLSLLVAMLSLGFTTTSCSPTDELSDESCDCGTVIGRREQDNPIQSNWYFLKLDFACDEREDGFVYVDQVGYYAIPDGDFYCTQY
tara:strand:+ start:1130 stop:1417 length:288 start_codon:yes stop_codon:yes gene_type:complete